MNTAPKSRPPENTWVDTSWPVIRLSTITVPTYTPGIVNVMVRVANSQMRPSRMAAPHVSPSTPGCTPNSRSMNGSCAAPGASGVAELTASTAAAPGRKPCGAA